MFDLLAADRSVAQMQDYNSTFSKQRNEASCKKTVSERAKVKQHCGVFVFEFSVRVETARKGRWYCCVLILL